MEQRKKIYETTFDEPLPESLFLDSVIAVGALILVLAAATAWLAGRRLRAHRDPPLADSAAPEQRTAVTREAR